MYVKVTFEFQDGPNFEVKPGEVVIFHVTGPGGGRQMGCT